MLFPDPAGRKIHGDASAVTDTQAGAIASGPHKHALFCISTLCSAPLRRGPSKLLPAIFSTTRSSRPFSRMWPPPWERRSTCWLSTPAWRTWRGRDRLPIAPKCGILVTKAAKAAQH